MAEHWEIDVDPTTLAVSSRESAHREFKQTFDAASLPKYARTMAAFANAAGGVLMFGVADKPRRLVGCTVPISDEAVIADQVQKYFEPAIQFHIRTIERYERTIHVVVVPPAEFKPIICKKNLTETVPVKKPGERPTDRTVLAEGDIYYRYAGKSERIRFAELHGIFEERDRRIFRSLQSTLAAIQKTGVDRIGIVDLHAAGSGGGITRMYVPREAVGSIRLIDRGRFVESAEDGDRAYYLAGTVEVKVADPIPVEDEDRIRPGDAAKLIAHAAKSLHPSFSPSEIHLVNFAKHRGWRKGTGDGQHNTRYCKYDKNSSLWFYRQAFIDELMKAIET